MIAKTFDGKTLIFSGEDVKEIAIEYGDYSIIIALKNGYVERAESIIATARAQKRKDN